jgi:hypothetical protein
LSGLVGVWFLAGVLSEMESAGPAHTGLWPMAVAMAASPLKTGAPLSTSARAGTSVPDASAALAGAQSLAEDPAPTF